MGVWSEPGSCVFKSFQLIPSVWPGRRPLLEHPASSQAEACPCPPRAPPVGHFCLLTEPALFPGHAGPSARSSGHCLWLSVPRGKPLHPPVSQQPCSSCRLGHFPTGLKGQASLSRAVCIERAAGSGPPRPLCEMGVAHTPGPVSYPAPPVGTPVGTPACISNVQVLYHLWFPHLENWAP